MFPKPSYLAKGTRRTSASRCFSVTRHRASCRLDALLLSACAQLVLVLIGLGVLILGMGTCRRDEMSELVFLTLKGSGT